MRLVLITAVLLLAVSSCSKNGKPIDSRSKKEKTLPAAASETGPRKGGKLIIGVQQEPEMLSEILNSMATNNMICNLIFSKFVRYNDSLKLVPDLIKEIPSLKNGGVSPDYLSYTYHIRKDAFWHDGIPVTSGDVKFTYEIIMDPLVNVESREGWDVIESIDIPNEKTVVFHLKQHYPDFIEETFYDESVLPEHILSSRRGAKFHSSTYHHAPVGSGPFKFKKWVSGSHLVLEGNERYYGEGPYLDEIIFKFIPDMNTLLVQLKTGEIDFFDNAEINFLDQIENIPGITVYKTPMLMYEHLDLNNANPILKDKLVRKALCYATNKREIVEKVYGKVVQIADLDEFPASKYYNSEAALGAAYNPLEARKLLHKAGWMDSDKDGILEKNGKKLSLTISTTSGQNPIGRGPRWS